MEGRTEGRKTRQRNGRQKDGKGEWKRDEEDIQVTKGIMERKERKGWIDEE